MKTRLTLRSQTVVSTLCSIQFSRSIPSFKLQRRSTHGVNKTRDSDSLSGFSLFQERRSVHVGGGSRVLNQPLNPACRVRRVPILAQLRSKIPRSLRKLFVSCEREFDVNGTSLWIQLHFFPVVHGAKSFDHIRRLLVGKKKT